MSETNSAELIELAKQGNSGAIAHLLNCALASQGITAKVNRQPGILTIFLDSQAVPDPSSLVGIIHKGIKDLRLETINSIKVYGRKTDEPNTGWREEIILQNNGFSEAKSFGENLQPHLRFRKITSQIHQYLEQFFKLFRTRRIGKRAIAISISLVCLVLLAFSAVFGFNWLQMRTAQEKVINQAQALVAEVPHPSQATDLDSLKAGTKKLDEAIILLKGIEDLPGSLYPQAQAKLKEIRSQLKNAEQRIDSETSVDQTLISLEQTIQETTTSIQNAPHSVEEWNQIKTKLDQITKQLEEFPQDSLATAKIKAQLVIAQKSRADVIKGLAAEEKAFKILLNAENKAKDALAVTESKTEYTLTELQQAQSLWWQAITLLKKVPNQSAAYQQVRDNAPIYLGNYKEIESSIQEMQACLKGGSSFCGIIYLSLREPTSTTDSNPSSNGQITDRNPFSNGLN